MNDGHKWTFSAPGVPWARYDGRGRRLPDNPDTWLDWLTRKYFWIRLVGYLTVAAVLLAIARS